MIPHKRKRQEMEEEDHRMEEATLREAEAAITLTQMHTIKLLTLMEEVAGEIREDLRIQATLEMVRKGILRCRRCREAAGGRETCPPSSVETGKKPGNSGTQCRST